MYALLHRALIFAVVLVGATLSTLSQEVGLVSGRVTDERGVPLKGALVTLSGPRIQGSQEATTDRDGRYWFPAVPGNQPLTMKAATPGRTSLLYVGYESRRSTAVGVDFTLRPPGEHEILALIEADVPYHQIALEGAVSTMPGHVSTLMVKDTGPETVRLLTARLDLKPSVVLAIGDVAARLARRHIQDVPVVYSMVPAPMDADLIAANLCGVPLNGGFDRQIEHLRHLMPEARRIGTIYDPHRMGRTFREAKQIAGAAGMDLVAAHLHRSHRAHGEDPMGIHAALDELAARQVDAIVLMLDPRTMDGDGFEQVTRFAQRHDIVLAVPDASMVMPGRIFSFVPGFWDLGAYAGTIVRRIVEGKANPSQVGMSYPDRETPGGTTTRLQARSFREVLPAGDTAGRVRIAREE